MKGFFIYRYLLAVSLLFIHWNPSPDFVSFGNFAIKWYGVLWGAGLMAAYFILEYIFKKLNRDSDKLTIGIQYVFIFGLIGARLAHILFYQLDFYLTHPQDILAVWKGGLASHGGVVGAIVGIYLFTRAHKEFSFLWVFDYGVIAACILSSLIRFGNLINSELIGTPTDAPWAFVFEQVDSVPRHPVVLYESIFYLLLQIVMLSLFLRFKDSRPGLYTGLFFAVLFSARFVLEFFKVPEGELFFGAISKTQLLNIPVILGGIILLYFALKGKLRYKEVYG